MAVFTGETAADLHPAHVHHIHLMTILAYAHEIRSAVLVLHGEKAHSCYFGKDAFAKLTGDNKELLLIPDAVHTDLYDDDSRAGSCSSRSSP